MAVRFKAGRYVADWRDPNGARRRRAFDTKRDALAFEAAERLRNPRGRSRPPASALTFKAWGEAWVKERSQGPDAVAGATVTMYGSALARLNAIVGDLPLQSIDRLAWRAALLKLSETFAPSTVSTTRAVGRAVFKSAVADGLLASDPTWATRARRLTRSEKVRAITVAEAGALLGATRNHDERAAISLGLMAGLRSGEILGLRWGDVASGVLRVSSSVSREDLVKVPKSAASARVIPASSDLRAALEAVERRGPFVIRGEIARDAAGVGALQSWLYARVRAAGRAAGVVATPHTLRHTWASALVAAGTPIPWVAKWAGHRDLAFTFRTYGSHLPPENATPLDSLAVALSAVSTTVHTPDAERQDEAATEPCDGANSAS